MMKLLKIKRRMSTIHDIPFRCRAISIFLLFLAIGISACTPSLPPVSFRDLCLFDKEQFGSADSDQVLSRIRDRVHIEPQKEVIGNSTGYYWQSGRGIHDAGLFDNRLATFIQREIDDGPKLGQIVAGLGPPETLYRDATVFEGVQYTIALEYPKQGVTVMRNQVARSGEVKKVDGILSLRISEDIQVAEINCYIPRDSLEDYLREVYRVRPESMEMQKKRRVTWPGFGAWVPLE